MAIFTKISPIFKTFLTNQGKNEDEDKKIRKISSNFEFFISKLGYKTIFMKIPEKKFWPIFEHIFD